MGRDAIKACENMCFKCRKEAAKYNDRLYSREGAAELLGVSVSSLAEYETGVTKVIPVDKIVLMAELYNAPELKVWYCTEECPIGRTCRAIPSPELTSVEQKTLQLLALLQHTDVENVTRQLINIAADGVITDEEQVGLTEIMGYLDVLIKAAGELRLICGKITNGGDNGKR